MSLGGPVLWLVGVLRVRLCWLFANPASGATPNVCDIGLQLRAWYRCVARDDAMMNMLFN